MAEHTAATAASGNRRAAFGNLKQQQIALNMQIRLAMQLHDTSTQEKLEEKMSRITEKINYFSE